MNPIERVVAEIYSTNEPITVVVDENRWQALGPETSRSTWLFYWLTVLGGINESVAPGTYHFNMKANWFKLIPTFEPVIEDPQE